MLSNPVMAKVVGTKFLVIAILFFSSTFGTSNEDFIYHCDDMFETADYLITLDKKISEHLNKLNPTLIPCLNSFSKYIDYLADKIEVGSNKEIKIIKHFGKEVVDGPAFLNCYLDLETMLEQHYWNYTIAQDLRDALNEANAMWARLTAVLAEHVQERGFHQKKRGACDVGDDCDICVEKC